MRLDPVLQRLGTLGIATLGDIAAHAQLTGSPAAFPAAFVLPDISSASTGALAGAIDLKVDTGFAVVLMLDPATMTTDQLATLSAAVVDRLLGWTHPDAAGPTLYSGEKPLGTAPGLIRWQISFTAPFRLRKAG